MAAPLADHLGAGGATADPARGGRRFSSVAHLADLFDRYALHRPQMLLAWARGEDSDGSGRALSPDGAWQAELWRRLRERIPEPDLAQRTGAACARLRDEPGLARLPARLSLFGLTRFPAGQLAVLRALALRARRAPVPAASLAGAVAGRRTATRPAVLRRSEDVTATLAANRLLASWGQDSRELQLVVCAGDDPRADHHHAGRARGGHAARRGSRPT